ncbi:MAG: peptidylprolyl isomerase [Desulfuromusa sp.]|nr:peptidylprolyl isomerase [Desulfuromusa sp.]
MKQLLLLVSCLVFFSGAAYADPIVEIKTSLGAIQIELNSDKAPQTVKNFLHYVDQKFYDDTIYHRVIGKFMIQGGGFDKWGKRKKTFAPIKNEAANGLKNLKGSIAMARTGVVDSATSQFFINLVDNGTLDHRGNTPRAFGYAVFGRVIAGMDIVEKIGSVKTIAKSSLFRNYPEPQIIIESIRRL